MQKISEKHPHEQGKAGQSDAGMRAGSQHHRRIQCPHAQNQDKKSYHRLCRMFSARRFDTQKCV